MGGYHLTPVIGGYWVNNPVICGSVHLGGLAVQALVLKANTFTKVLV
jgi:hypothetical protein